GGVLRKTEPCAGPAAPVSDESADLLMAMMAAKTEERIASYAELIARIDALPCMQAAPVAVVAPRRSSARRPRWRVYATAAVAGLVLAGGAVVAAKLVQRDPGANPVKQTNGPVAFVPAGPAAARVHGATVAGAARAGVGVAR